MAETSQTPKSLKAQITRTSLVLAAAALLREQGPKAVTYRKVAKWAGAASSSVGYYFDSVTQLLHEAGRYNIQLWAERAEKAASARAKIDMPPRMVGTVVDGAAVAAISEGYDVRKFASDILRDAVEVYIKASEA